jgi:hypothetical protein
LRLKVKNRPPYLRPRVKAITGAQGRRRGRGHKRVADADRYQKLTVAMGEAQAIETVFSAIHKGNPTNDLIAIK